ncbi:MAG: class I SAM-dependent methyltransferase [Gemmatimonadota bacterium]
MSIEAQTELERLSTIAADSWYANGSNGAMVRYSAKVLRPYWHGTTCLELGPAEGLMTASLAETFPSLTLVDGSEQFAESLRKRYPSATVVQSLFEAYEPTQHFDTIVLGHVLEHVDNPRALLAKARGWLADGGNLCAVVPNAMSIHRQAAVLMGLLQDVHQMNDTDRHHGHRRVYDPDSFQADFHAAGLTIKASGGYWIKPLSMAQIDSSWTPGMLDAFMQLGERYPDIAAEIYVIAGA